MRHLFSRSLFCVALVSLAAGLRPATAQIGIAAGLNYENLTDLDIGDVSATFDNASGYHAGIYYDVSIGTVGLRIGAFYRDLGEFDADWGQLDSQLGKVDLAMIDFPVDIRLNLTATPILQPYILVGPVFSLPSSGLDAFDSGLESLIVSGNIGAGLALNLAGLRLFPELRYAIGISRLLKDQVEIGGIQLNTDVQRINSVMLRLGILL